VRLAGEYVRPFAFRPQKYRVVAELAASTGLLSVFFRLVKLRSFLSSSVASFFCIMTSLESSVLSTGLFSSFPNSLRE